MIGRYSIKNKFNLCLSRTTCNTQLQTFSNTVLWYVSDVLLIGRLWGRISPTGNLAQPYLCGQQRGDVEELPYMARFLNKPEEEYKRVWICTPSCQLKLFSFRLPPGADLYFRKNTPAKSKSKNKHGCFSDLRVLQLWSSCLSGLNLGGEFVCRIFSCGSWKTCT